MCRKGCSSVDIGPCRCFRMGCRLPLADTQTALMMTLNACPTKYCKLGLVVLLMLSALYVMTSHMGSYTRDRVLAEKLSQDAVVDPLFSDTIDMNSEIRPLQNNVGNIGVKNEGTNFKKEQLEPRAVTAPPAAGERNHVTPVRTPMLDTIDNLPHNVVLDPKLAPNTVYYVWCGRSCFEFVHYLSVVSVMRHVRPDNVVFYYHIYPVLDTWHYNTWFDEIKRDYPFFRPRFVNASGTDKMCEGHGLVNMSFVHQRLSHRGGIYINENTILGSFPIGLRRYDLVDAFDARGSGFLLSRGGLPGARSVSAVLRDPTARTTSLRCAATIADYNAATDKPVCVTPKYKLFPKDIWTLDSDFGRITRNVFYGRPEVPIQRQSFDDLVPNIAHVVWLGGGPMDFLFYLCVLSLIYVAKVMCILLSAIQFCTGCYENVSFRLPYIRHTVFQLKFV